MLFNISISYGRRYWGAFLFLLIPLLSAGCAPAQQEETQPALEDETPPTEITLSAAQVSAIGVETVEVSLNVVGDPLALPGRVLPEPDREAYVTSLLAGRIDSVFVTLGDIVRASQPVAHITSPALGDLIADLKRTHAENERQIRLTNRGVGIRKNLEDANTNFAAARQSLLSIGFSPENLARLLADEDASGLTLVAPISGYVLERNAILGGPVAEGERLFYLAALNPIIVSADAFERDLVRLQKGIEVTVTTPGGPLHLYTGRITDIVPQVDPDKRTVTVRIRLPNPDGFLKPGMYATVLVNPIRDASVHTLPADAIRSDNRGSYVLVARNDTTFERTAVAAQVGASGFVAVPELALGTRVVTLGGYQVMSAMNGVEVEDD